MTLFEIAQAIYLYNMYEPNVESISPQDALHAAVEAVIEGDLTIADTEDRAAHLSETEGVNYTPYGYEYNASTLYDALSYIYATPNAHYIYPFTK